MSASPAPCATHVPPHARSTGSMAVTRPLGGTLTSTDLPRRVCMYGSRFETTKSLPSSSRARTCTASRSAVHVDSPVSRSFASNSAAVRAVFRLSAKVATSRANGRNSSRSGTLIRPAPPRPVRKAFIQWAVLAIGPAMLQRTMSSVMREIRKTWASALRKVSRQIRRLSARMYPESCAIARLPMISSARCRGNA